MMEYNQPTESGMRDIRERDRVLRKSFREVSNGFISVQDWMKLAYDALVGLGVDIPEPPEIIPIQRHSSAGTQIGER